MGGPQVGLKHPLETLFLSVDVRHETGMIEEWVEVALFTTLHRLMLGSQVLEGAVGSDEHVNRHRARLGECRAIVLGDVRVVRVIDQ